jgi:hypothetical protein
MKLSFTKAMIYGCTMLVVLIACGKLGNLLNSEMTQFNADSNELKGELDQADTDINDALKDMPGFGKTGSGQSLTSSALCGVIIDTSDIDQNILYFNFDGTTPCFSPSRTRSGQIKVELISGSNWANAGAVLRETFIDYKITRLSDNKSITFNGEKTLTNLNGNDWLGFFLSYSTLKYAERALDIDVTFDNNQTAVWNSARITEWSYVQANSTPGIQIPFIKFEAVGDTSLNGIATVDSWGTNRYGQPFVTYYNQELVSNTYCGLWRPNSGELVHEVDGDTYTLTLGVDQNGNAATGNCAYGFEVSWDINGTANSQVFSY